MKDIITLKSTDGEQVHLKRLARPDNKESATYILKYTDCPMNSGYNVSGKRFIALGGCTIVVGEYLEEAAATVDSIVDIDGGFVITFKK